MFKKLVLELVVVTESLLTKFYSTKFYSFLCGFVGRNEAFAQGLLCAQRMEMSGERSSSRSININIETQRRKGKIMEWAAKPSHWRGIPRRMVIASVGSFAKLVTCYLNNTTVQNAQTLLRLVRSRPPGVPLLTVSNHMSTLDDPLLWGFKGFPTLNSKYARWSLTAEDICFTNPVFSYFFRLGKCIPIIRGAGIYQTHMNEALELIDKGEWLHTFPEGKISQDKGPIRRLKWGTASLIVRASVPPIVLPIVHSGFETVMPEKYWLGRRPFFPLPMKRISIVIGEPLQFDLPILQQKAVSFSKSLRVSNSKINENDTYLRSFGWPAGLCRGLGEIEQKWLFVHISDQIRKAMQTLLEKVETFECKIDRQTLS